MSDQTTAQKPKRGRPRGTTDRPPVVTMTPSRCGKCGSTNRGPYFGRTEQAVKTVHDGVAYTHVVRRRVRCADCGQVRLERTPENRPQYD